MCDTAAHGRRIVWTDDEELLELIMFLVVSLQGEADSTIILRGGMVNIWVGLAVGED